MRYPEDEEKTVHLMMRSHHRALSTYILHTYLEIAEEHHDFGGCKS